MPLLKRQPRQPRRVRPVQPRVFLSKADRKIVNTLKPVEKVAGLVVSFYTAVMTFALLALSTDGFGGGNRVRLALGLAVSALCALLVHFTNRWLAGIGAIGLVYGVPWGKWFVLALLPLLYFVLLNLRIFRDQRKMTELRASEGNFGLDPRSEAAKNRRAAKSDERATADAAGRQLAPASKRYTPPKVAKKKR